MSALLFAHLLFVFVPAHHSGDAAGESALHRVMPGNMAGNRTGGTVFEASAGFRLGR
jgi:hypothetical protein